MQVVTVDLHHQVLTAWAEYRRTLSMPPEVLSFDFHTDVMRCFRRNAPDPEGDAWANPGIVADAVARLRHDEHFDWALRGGAAAEVRIISLSPCAVEPEHEKMQVIRHPGLPDMETMLNVPEQFRPLAAAVLSDGFLAPLVGDKLPEQGFILDVDCDYFLCREALFPEHRRIFDTLVKRAGLVTISRENDWVRLLKLPGENIDGTTLAQTLEKVVYAVLETDC